MDLKTMHNTKPGKPKIKYLEGAAGIKQAYEATFEADEIRIQCFTEDYKDVVSSEFFDDYFTRFFASNIKSKELLRLGDDAYIKQYGSPKNLQLRVDTKDLATETDFWVYGKTVAFISFNKQNPYALIIEDEDIANSLRTMYDLAWKAAAQDDPRVKAGEKVRTEFGS